MKETSCRIFVARVPDSISAEDLENHFSSFGQVTDVYYPNPFRGFAFVTFVDSHVAQSLLGKDHVIKGHSVHIGHPNPKSADRKSRNDNRRKVSPWEHEGRGRNYYY